MTGLAGRFGRKLTVGIILAASFAFTGVVFAATGAGTELYHRMIDFGNGMTYTNAVSENDSGRQESYFAEITPGSDAVPVVFADDTIYGKLTLDDTISYAQGQGYTVLGGMNTDFFSMAYGVPMGLVVEEGRYKSSPEGYRAVCFTADGHAAIQEETAVEVTLTNLGGSDAADHRGEGVALTHFNKFRSNNAGLYLYDEYFSTVSTRTSGNGWYVKFRILEGTMKTKGTMKLQVVEKLESEWPLDIGEGYMVLTAGVASGLGVDYRKFDVGDVVQLETHCWGSEIVENAVWATGAGDLIVDNGQVTDSSGWDRALLSANPRSAIGIKADGTVVYYTIDGRSSKSRGLTMQQLAEELIARGCVQAVNMDGGGSTTFGIQFPNQDNPTLQNRPSDGSERRCSTFVLFTTQKESDGIPTHLYLTDLGAIVYQGSRVPLEYLATDAANQPCEAPDDIETTVVKGLGTVKDGEYYAGWGSGYVDFTLNSPSTGASGTTQIMLTNRLDSLSVAVNGESPSDQTITMDKGQSVRLAPSATYLGKSVIINSAGLVYEVTEGTGTVSEDGILTAAAAGSGQITVSAGGQSVSLSLVVNDVAPSDNPPPANPTKPEDNPTPSDPDDKPSPAETKDPSEFSDTKGTWAQPYITDLYNRGIVKGLTAEIYGLDTDIRRGDFVLMLYRAADSPEVEGSVPFADVSPDKYYADAITWAASEKIALGTGRGFEPEASLTREQSFALVHRYLLLAEDSADDTLTEPDASVLDQFTDRAKLADYAETPAAALVEASVIGGADGKIMPKDSLTRGQMARILSSALEYLEHNTDSDTSTAGEKHSVSENSSGGESNTAVQ